MDKTGNMALKIYVGGAYGNKKNVQNLIDNLKAKGHTITHDWTRVVKHDTKESKMQEAVNDINGVKNATLVVIIMDDPNYAYRGTWTEMGAAMATDKHILVITNGMDTEKIKNVFIHHPNVSFVAYYDDLIRVIESGVFHYPFIPIKIPGIEFGKVVEKKK